MNTEKKEKIGFVNKRATVSSGTILPSRMLAYFTSGGCMESRWKGNVATDSANSLLISRHVAWK